ncbi:MAG: SusE domain-containing protein [Flavobacterium sp.]|uniref:SusE domain-containing protein n=1 Tax=Flavobacterium sp. TaxID=239 RepID=UPI0037A6FD3C
MKNLLKISTLALLLIAGVSCENDDQTIASASGGPELLTPLDGSSYTLSPATATAEITTLVWNHADYSVQTEVNYDVEVALAGTDFATVIPAGSTTNRFLVWTHEALNAVALQAGLIPYSAGDLDVRIKSSLGSNSEMVAYSNTITLTITPYTTDLPQIAVPGNHQGWSPSTAPRLAASGFGQTDYEGYVALDGEFKFVGPNGSGAYEWGNDDWGDDGTFSGMLALTGESNCTATAGYYKINANTTTLTYTTTLTTWGVLGSATAPVTGGDGWGTDANMTYNPTTKKWSIVINLVGGQEIKFRANDAWGLNYGDNGADASLEEGGSNIAVPSTGDYLVELDLSNPRAYTYTLTPQ